MASRRLQMPIAPITRLRKQDILANLRAVDNDPASQQRVIQLEQGFRARVASHVASLTGTTATLEKYSTSPFVLLIYAHAKRYTKISQIEQDILPAKLFSSMETSAGRMIEDVVLPIYRWQSVPSGMHTVNSALDGKQVALPVLKAVTLKSGPRCLNDGMSENLADAVLNHGAAWMTANGATSLEFTYGVLYGTKRQSNKKDWHILRNIAEKLPPAAVVAPPWQRWDCSFRLNGVQASATVRVGKDWWDYLGGPLCLTEVCAALIRACIAPGQADPAGTIYLISDLGIIVAMPPLAQPFASVVLQSSQIPWLFFLMKHFCDHLED